MKRDDPSRASVWAPPPETSPAGDRAALAVKRPAQTNGNGAGIDLKRRSGDGHAAIGHLIPTPRGMRRLIDPALLADPYAAANFIGNVLEASTETSIIGTDLEGNIQLWNEGARRLYGYEPEEGIGKANSTVLHTTEDVKAGFAQQMTATAIETGKFEGSVVRLRKNGTTFPARVVVTPRRGNEGEPIGFLFISRDVSDEVRL